MVETENGISIRGFQWIQYCINSVRMRFADVLLMYAEAVNERFGPRDDAKEALKRVRRRAFEPSLWANKVESYVESLNSEEEFFRAIMNERKWEFGGESIRKYDLARWNKYNEVIYNLYYEMINWGLVATGTYVPGIEKVPERIFIKQYLIQSIRIELFWTLLGLTNMALAPVNRKDIQH